MKLIAAMSLGFFLGAASGLFVGRKYSENPTINVYRNQRIITEPGDAICPTGHMCTWKAWDVTADVPVGKP